MKSSQMLLSAIPWLLFSAIINRTGSDAAAIAAAVAAVIAAVLVLREAGASGVKFIDMAGVLTFGVLAVIGFAGGEAVGRWISDYGRGSVTLVLATVMLVSAATVPFTEQYARESVSREYWRLPRFRAVNRRISALWGAVVGAMGLLHLLAGVVDPVSTPAAGARPVDLLLNWVLPIALSVFAVKQTRRLASAASTGSDQPVPTMPGLPERQDA